MRILVLGGDGMMGHQVFRYLDARHEVRVTLRRNLAAYKLFRLFDESNAFSGVDVRSLDRLTEVMAEFRPEAVINAVGVVKQRPAAKELLPSLEINAVLPHRLSVLCKAAGARLVQVSTDCVFNGRKGNYLESDSSDAEDIYGRTKFLGELHDLHCLTLRTSIIGRELSRKESLVEWFLAQKGTVQGFTKAIYTGFSTLEMSRIIEMMLVEHPQASGVYHVSSDPINKYDLLSLIKREMNLDTVIIPTDDHQCDRSLNSTIFRSKFGYMPPPWTEMVEEMVKDFSGSSCNLFSTTEV
jgi:dTDP-4-dehydrorhamnose reductase